MHAPHSSRSARFNAFCIKQHVPISCLWILEFERGAVYVCVVGKWVGGSWREGGGTAQTSAACSKLLSVAQRIVRIIHKIMMRTFRVATHKCAILQRALRASATVCVLMHRLACSNTHDHVIVCVRTRWRIADLASVGLKYATSDNPVWRKFKRSSQAPKPPRNKY